MLTLAQLNSNQKTQQLPSNHSIDRDPLSDRRTYRFVQIRSGSFRSKSKDIRLAIDERNNLQYEFRRPSLDGFDDQTCSQFKVA